MSRGAERRSWRARARVPLLAVLALNAVVFLAYTLPRGVQERGLERRLDALRADVARERERSTALRERARLIHDNTRDASRLVEELLPTRSEGLLELLQELEASARGAGLSMRSRSYEQDAVPDLPVVRVAISAPVRGSYRQLVDFVERLEASSRFLVVDRVELRGREASSGAEMNVYLSAYFRKDPEAADAD